jgi:hypothetical protein
MAKAQEVRSSHRLEWFGLFIAFLAMAATAWQAYIARETMRESLRAYVTAKGANWVTASFQGKEPTPSDIINEVAIAFENSGSSPAFHLDTNVSYKFSTQPLSKDFNYLESRNNEGTGGPNGHGIMPPHLPNNFIIGLNPVEDLNRLIKGDTRLYVYGHVSYDDIFKDRHTTIFCFQHHFPENVFHQCAAHNDTYDGDYKP